MSHNLVRLLGGFVGYSHAIICISNQSFGSVHDGIINSLLIRSQPMFQYSSFIRLFCNGRFDLNGCSFYGDYIVLFPYNDFRVLSLFSSKLLLLINIHLTLKLSVKEIGEFWIHLIDDKDIEALRADINAA